MISSGSGNIDRFFYILAGGLGKRAEPLTNYLPKPLFPLDGTPLIKIITGQLSKVGVNRGFINVHHMASMITNLRLPGIDCLYLHEKILSGNRILSTFDSNSEKNVMVINGDTYLDIPFNKMKREMDNYKPDGVILVRKKDGEYSSIITKGKHFIKRDKNPDIADIIYAGVSIFRNGFLKELRSKNLFDSLEISNGKILTLEYKGLWLDLGTPENYFLSNRAFRTHHGKTSGNSFSENVSVAENSEVKNSIVWSNTKISGKTIITDSIVTGNINIQSGNFLKKIISEKGVSDLNI